jgi:hypothetical protein
MEKPKGKGPLGRSRHRWEDNIKMEWVQLAQDRGKWWVLVNAVMNPGFSNSASWNE